ncbi:MAG TPA: F420-nonreducing hydrogenase [Bryobacteraceae bacterium]|nr:F420-nonreducing hydrogenase [Bryobacteraceae bacterium]
MSAKPKVAFYWCASCGGCEEAVVDLAEGILDVAAAIEIVMWPVAMDFKRKDIEAVEDGSIVATFLNGAIRSTEQEEMARLLRRKSQFMIAFGACAQLGGIPGLANLWDRKSIFQRVYSEVGSVVNPEGVVPQVNHVDNGRHVHLPGFYDTVKTLEQVVDVDYLVPGCPPTPDLLKQAVEALLGGKLPPKGTVLAPDRALCDECPRKETKPDKLSIAEFKRPHQVLIDQEKCLLAQGLLCIGPATRGGCGTRCIQGNMPCTGCFGPTSRVRDFGAKAMSGLASLLEAKDDEGVIEAVGSIPDPVGSFYRYSLPASLLVRKKVEA